MPERREFQRLGLEHPIVGRFGSANVLILNVGVSGALLEHHAAIVVGERRRLVFNWTNHEVALLAEVARSAVERFAGTGEKKTPIHHSGVHFVEAIGESDRWLRHMIGFYVTRGLEMQKANARGVKFDESAFPDPALTRLVGVRGDSTGYVSCRLGPTGWKKMPTLKGVQPADGFTISATEQDVELLCRTYEEANEEGRRLLRMLAELSVSEVRRVPPPKYEP